MPDLTGLSVSQVRSRLSALGLYSRSSGSEDGSASLVARRQDVAADTEVAKGTGITVEFSDLSQRAE